MTERKYNRVLPESEGNVLCLEIGQRVTLDDYVNIFEPPMRAIVAKYSDARAVISYTRPFLGWDIDAAEHDIATIAEVGRHVRRIALVHPTEQVAQRWLTFKPLFGGDVKIFNEGEFDNALAWAKAE